MTSRSWGLFYYLPLPVLAAESVDTSASLVNLVQVILALAVVLAAIFGAATLFRRFSGSLVSAQGYMKVVSALMVGQRERVVIVALGGEWLVLGVTSHSINLLARMPSADVPVVAAAEPFKRWLKAVVGKKQQRSGSPHL